MSGPAFTPARSCAEKLTSSRSSARAAAIPSSTWPSPFAGRWRSGTTFDPSGPVPIHEAGLRTGSSKLVRIDIQAFGPALYLHPSFAQLSRDFAEIAVVLLQEKNQLLPQTRVVARDRLPRRPLSRMIGAGTGYRACSG